MGVVNTLHQAQGPPQHNPGNKETPHHHTCHTPRILSPYGCKHAKICIPDGLWHISHQMWNLKTGPRAGKLGRAHKNLTYASTPT